MAPAAPQAVQLSTGEYLLLDFARPDGPSETIGVILRDPAADRVYVRFRRDWEEVDPDQADVLEAYEEHIDRAARDMGSAAFFDWLESSLSHEIRTGDRETVVMHRAEKTLADLYRRFVPSTIRRYQTHVPLYSCRAAATKFSEQQDVSEEAWIEVEPGRRLDGNMFAAHVVGRSMEPKIPSGSLCLFRGNLAGTRQGKLVLVEDRSARGGETERFTIKQYWSEKSDDPERLQSRILLKPLNPEFEAWDLDENGQYSVIAEFIEVLD